MKDIYGIDVSPQMVSLMTDKVIPLIAEWQERPLSSLYVVLYLDGTVAKLHLFHKRILTEHGRITV